MSDLRISFIGTCQVAGMKATASALLPKAHIDAQHIFATMQPEAVPDHIKDFDVVITQISDGDPRMPYLGAGALNESGIRTTYLPTFVFSGLHPDMTYIMDGKGMISGAYSDMHSLLGVACYLAECDARQAAKLFNAYVFAELGYLDEFEISRKFMMDSYSAAGYDVDGLIEHLLVQSGSFMHTTNHPSISILSHLATQALVKAGVVPQGTPVPEGIPDALHNHFVGPVFPPIARRVGLSGSVTYLRPARAGEDRSLSLEEYLSRSYEIYRGLERDRLAQGRAGEVANTVSRLLR